MSRKQRATNTPKHTRIKTRFWMQKGYSEKHIPFCWRTYTGWYICDTAKTYVWVAIETRSCNILQLVVNVAFLKRLALLGVASSISPYLKHYEGLSYDREALHRRHLRARRATASQENTLKLDFTAFHRWFHHFYFSLFLFLNIYTRHHLNLPGVDRFTHFPVNFMCSFRTFRLHLKHDSEAFSENFTVITENGPISADLSHMYSGILEGGYHLVSIHLN